jgi:diaminobutyrate-2-oxoglutarate transaminase
MGDGIDTAEYLDKTLCDPSSGVDSPAAIIIETVQGEGGLQAASREWMQSIVKIAHQHGALLIIDDIQAGCGRTGNFFSFETLDVTPDMVCMAKSISGYGLPMSLLLIRPELDIWEPGEHNGTFRGNNFAFVTAIAALETFWTLSDFKNKLQHLCTGIAKKTHELAETYGVTVKGRGAMIGLEFNEPNQAKAVQQDCIRQGLIIELCGPHDEVLKFLPPLTISAEELDMGFQFIDQALKNQCSVQMEAVHSRIPLMKTAKGSSVARNRQSPPP